LNLSHVQKKMLFGLRSLSEHGTSSKPISTGTS
jgi:hypothetical protein